MVKVRVETFIEAPIEVVFDAARDISLHLESTSHTGERAVAGVTSGLIGHNDTVTFEARHLGIRHRLTARIVEFDSPHRFVDQMISGPFKAMKHYHLFEERERDV